MPTAKVHSLVGQDVVLECSAVGNPQPIITWEKYGGEMNLARSAIKFGTYYYTVEPRYLELAYFELPLISK